ncbi:hypothetical protein FFLO_01599 [Filobasidium floriforme]|uniref:Uncharacterized protein n=1 Tax=Filobasidium floriforme TaxID=5210 RepID=A0A8K0NSG9_9TREE|nr:uncharacterized protein HD553DRAFT_326029 [Filobasidium floriforme]KAG7562909.1 hypothetical protein FFLO_01599 [Filobasidium floriforme]KAH8080640.1 hypothetical protein HD553DRAFT_326029 [Filobasidium floriforme]
MSQNSTSISSALKYFQHIIRSQSPYIVPAEAANNNNVKFCDGAAQEVKQSAFTAWYSVQASPSTQPYGTTKDVARFLDCVDLCDADRKPQNEADPDNVENASNGCRSVTYNPEKKECKQYTTLPQNVMTPFYPAAGSQENVAIIDPCGSDRMKQVRYFPVPGMDYVIYTFMRVQRLVILRKVYHASRKRYCSAIPASRKELDQLLAIGARFETDFDLYAITGRVVRQ